jgi:hypothetical protein
MILSKGPKLEEELKKIERDTITVKDLDLPFAAITRHLVVVRIEK